MNILSIVSYNFLPPKMGGQKGIALFYKFFASHVNLICITTKNNDVAFAENYRVLNILSNNPLRYINIFYFFSLKKIIKKNKITHVIIEHPYYGWLGVLLKWFCKIKLVVHSHNIEALRFKSMNKWWWGILWNYEKFTHRRADINFFIHDDDKAYAINKFKLNAEKCSTITYGFELKRTPSFEEILAAGKIITARYAIKPEEKIILFNGT
ncbi:MAG: glycosyltransferase [Chitinophagaceae bacterium]|nr:glycosyltransferase [Chitinophagaceae bacterium]